jgi:cell division septal protein FtsQ
MKIKAQTEKRFRRSKSKPGRKRRFRAVLSWRALRIVATTLVIVYATYRAGDLFFNSRLLQVQRIRVHGNVKLSGGEVQALMRGLQGSNILTVNLARYRDRLLESPWVAEVGLRRVLPSTVDVYVSERRPFGLCRLGNQLYLIDRDGTVVDEFGPQYAEFDLPIVDGLVRAPKNGAPTVDDGRAELAARVVDSIQGSRDLIKRVSQIDVTDAHDAVVLLDNDPALLHVGEERFRERLQSYLEIADALKRRIPDIDYVDLRFEQRVYVKPRGNADRTTLHLATVGGTN